MSYHVFMFYYVLCFYYVLYFYYISVCGINPIQKGAAHRLHPFFNHKPYVYFIFISLPQNHQRAISLQKVHLWMEISADCPNRGRRSLTKIDRQGNVQSSVWTLQQILLDKTIYHNTSSKSPRGQSLCRKSTSGWRFLQAVPIVADAVWLRWTGKEMSRAACGRCNRYCPTDGYVLFNIFNNMYI